MTKVITCALSLASFAGCGVPIENSAQTARGPSVVVRLNLPTSSVAQLVAPTSTVALSPAALILYFVLGDGLVSRVRIFDSKVDAFTALAALSKIPSDDPTSDLKTGLGGGAVIKNVGLSDDSVVVDLSDDFALIAGNEQILVLGQITLTLIANQFARSVVFTQRGEKVSVPNADGEPQARPMVRDDYRALLAR